MSYVGNKPAQTTIPVDDSVTTAMVQDDAVTADKVANAINTSIAANTSKVTNATHTGDVTGATALTIATDAVDIAMLSATGTADSTTFLRGDNAWAEAGGGKVLQQVSSLYATYTSTATTIPIDDTIPQNTEGLEVTTLAITPESATSKLHIEAWVYGGSSAAAYVMGALFVDSTANAIGAITQHKPTAHSSGSIYFATVVDSSSTVARTYKLRAGTNSGTFYINGSYSGRKFGGVATSGLVITEVEA
jgi:hypothetical protein